MTDSFSQNNESQTQGTPASAPSTAPQDSYWGNPPQTPLPNRMPGQPGSYPPYQAPCPSHPSAAAPAPNPQQPNQGANPYVQPAQTAAPYTQPNSYQQPTQQAPTQQPTHQQTQQHVQPNTQPNQQPSEPPVWQPTQQQEQPSFRQPAEQVAEQSIPQSTYTQTPPPAAPVTPQKKTRAFNRSSCYGYRACDFACKHRRMRGSLGFSQQRINHSSFIKHRTTSFL